MTEKIIKFEKKNHKEHNIVFNFRHMSLFFEIFVCFYSDCDYNKMQTAVPFFWIFFIFYACLFCSHIFANIIKFFSTVMQVGGLPSYKTRFGNPFIRARMPAPNSGI